MELEIKNVLLYNAFDNKDTGKYLANINTNKNANEDFFKSPLFVKYSSDWYIKTVRNFANLIKRNSIVTLYGGAGRGKTTFLKYIATESSEFNNSFNFCFLNLIEDSSSHGDHLINDIVRKQINKQFETKSNMLCQKYINLFQKNKKNVFFYNIDEEIFFRDFIYNKNDDISDDFYKNIQSVSKDSYTENLLFIYMMNCLIINEETIKKKENITFIFDNLDELSQVYIVNEIFNIVLNLYSRLQEIAHFFGFSFAQFGRIILSFRETNSCLKSSVQQNDRIKIRSETFQFDPPENCSIKEILTTRLKFFQEHTKQNDYDINTKSVIDTLEILLNVDNIFLSNTVIPLFNYDSRIIIDMILKISEVIYLDTDKTTSFININKTEYISIYNSGNKFGARGILFLAIFKYLYNQNTSVFRKIISEEILNKELCHFVRMGLAISYNLSRYPQSLKGQNLKINNEEKFDFAITFFGVNQLFEKLKFWYDEKTIHNIMMILLNIAENNFEKFAIIHPTQYPNYTNSIIDVIDNHMQTWIEKNDISNLSKFNIQILSSSIIYCEKIFIHYEYCNLIRYIKNFATTDNFIYNVNTIYQIMNNSIKTHNTNLDETYNTIKLNISEVYDICDDLTQRVDKYFCKKYIENKFESCLNCKTSNKVNKNCIEAVKDFKIKGFSIRDTLFISRLISNHIRYLDYFRMYLFNLQFLLECNRTYKDFNELILNQIKKYIDLYNGFERNGLRDIKSIIKKYEENYTFAIGDLNMYYPIISIQSEID